MNTTNVPTEWLVKLEELIEKVTTIYSESTTENYNLGALSSHFKASKYFNQPEQSIELDLEDKLKSFLKWYYSEEAFLYDSQQDRWDNVKEDTLATFSEVYKAFQNREK